MANFDQNVTIDIELKSSGSLLDAVAKIETLEETLDSLDDDIDSFNDSLEDIDTDSLARNIRELDSAAKNLESSSLQIGGDDQIKNIQRQRAAVTGLADSISRLRGVKEDVNDEQERVEESAESSSDGIDKEAKSFKQAIGDAEGLAAAKKAASDSNKLLNESAEDSIRGLINERVEMDKLDMDAQELGERLGILSEKEEEVAEANEDGSESFDKETRSVRQLAEEMDGSGGLAAAKDAVSRGNKRLSKMNEKTSETLQEEFGISKEFSDQLVNLREETDDTSDSFRNLRRRSDKMGDSMRAANKIGDLFEDGLGSLSVNLGAFTVALRNFLTQIPLLLTGLGALGTAVTGVAGSFITAGSAIAAAIGAGAIGMAEEAESKYSELESTGEALQAIMTEIKSTFREAVDPIVSNADAIDVFRRSVEGLASVTHDLSSVFSQLITRTSSWKDGISGVSGLMSQMNDRLRDDLREVMGALSIMFKMLQDEFLDILEGSLSAFADLILFSTKFVDGITESNEELSILTDTLAEVSIIGKEIFSGIMPLLAGFLGAIRSIAEVLNKLNAELVANVVTFGLIFGAISRFGGIIGSVISVIPNLIFAIITANGSVAQLSNTFGDYIKQQKGVLGGMSSLAKSIDNVGDQMREMSVRTEIAEGEFGDLSDELEQVRLYLNSTDEGLEEVNEELVESALAAEASEEQIEDVTDELKNLSSVSAGTGAVTLLPGLSGTGGTLATLKGVASGVTTALSGMITPLLVIISLLGGVLVGAVTNLDTSMKLLSETSSVIAGSLKFLTEQVLLTFISVWNALVDITMGLISIIEPIASEFDNTASSGEVLASVFSIVGTAFEIVFEVIRGTIFVLGRFTGWVLEAIGFIVELGVTLLTASEEFQAVAEEISGITGSGFSSWIDGIIRAFENAIFILTNFEEAMMIAARSIERRFAKLVNSLITKVKDMNGVLPEDQKLKGIAEIEKVEVPDKIETRAEAQKAMARGPRASRSELSSASQELADSIMPKGNNNISLNETDQTTVNQTVNADPEDKEGIKRTVKDAMEEADSFNRRRNGFTGN